MWPIVGQLPKKRGQGGGSQFEEEPNRLEKKRQGRESQFEEEPNRQKVEDEEDANDNDFDEDDYIADNGDNFTSEYETIERGFELNVPDVYVDDKVGRKCDQVRICGKYQHESEFTGSPVFELYKVKLILNTERCRSLSGKLYGVIDIITSRENPEPICYYRVKRKNAVPITLDHGNNSINLVLSGPETNPPMVFCKLLRVNFAFKIEKSDGTIIDVFNELGYLHKDADAEIFDDDGTARYCYLSFVPCSVGHQREIYCSIYRNLLGYSDSEAIKVAAYFSAYDGAWAAVDVKILKEGVSRFYGFIYARSCIFYSRIRLLSLRSNEMRELQASKAVELTRRVVVVPSFSSVIIAVLLYDQDGNLIVCGKTFFCAKEEGNQSKYIGDHNVSIEVKWAVRSLF